MDRYIFDIDGTLLNMNWDMEDELFKNRLDAIEFAKFIKVKVSLLYGYEDLHEKYEFDSLIKYFKEFGITISKELLEEWIYSVGNVFEDKIVEDAYEVLEYLKERNKKMSILTNWFSTSQIARLKRAGIYDYFDTIICGDTALKPTLRSYTLAASNTPFDKCIMIGDNPDKDYNKALDCGMRAYLVNKENPLIKIKKLGE